MTDKDMYKYQSKDVFDEALEKYKADETHAFCKSQMFSSFEDAAVAYKTLVKHYNGLSKEEKLKFQADTVDLASMEIDAKKKAAASPTKKLRSSKKTSPRTRASSVKSTINDDVIPTKVVALFTPDGAQYFANENHAHFALEKYRKDKGVDVKAWIW